jgi:signal transduction histidine kinase
VATLIVFSWLVLWALGIRFIAVPLEKLVDKTRRVGRGDFSGDVEVTGKDELACLASAMNEMCAQLESAKEMVRRETDARMETLDQLRHSERLAVLGRLSSGLAHELGTPLNVIAGRATMIATENLVPGDVVAFSKTIAEQARRMTEIIHQLLGFARRRHPRQVPSDINELAGQIVSLLAPSARKENVSVALEKAEEVPEVSADRLLIQQVLMNLVMNGIHAMPGGGRLTISTGVARARQRKFNTGPEHDYVTVRVEDEGVGMSQEQIDQAFAPFFTTKEHGKGTGLGLTIAQGIVEEHDGWIEVHSELGKGSCFTVYLPSEGES